MERDYADRGVQFYYIYKSLAHPENNGYVAPFNLKERLLHIAEAKRTLDTRFQWLCDTMDNDLKHTLGDRPNSEFLIDPSGRILVARPWSDPAQLRQDLEKHVGLVVKPTRVSDLNRSAPPPPQRAATGVVKRLTMPGSMTPVKIEPIETPGTPHYAKLRAEMGGGKLYLGFFLDPLYQVHWNNNAAPLRFEVIAPSGVSATPAKGVAPTVDVPADADPREFLVDIDGRSRESLRVSVSYFACDDAETFCKQVTQEYLVFLERDPDGGSRRSSGRGGRNASRRPGGSSVAQPPQRQMFERMRRLPLFQALDRDGDGELSARELETASRALRELDRNRDGQLSGEELSPTAFRARADRF